VSDSSAYPNGIVAAILRAVLRRALGSGRTEIRESEFVQVARAIVIGHGNVVTTGLGPTETVLRELALESLRLAAETPGLRVTLAVRNGEYILEVVHIDDPGGWLVDESPRRPLERVRYGRPAREITSGDEDRIRPNDRCWCGSGQKYKRCHGA
jgi:hypothetical protein